MNIVLKQLTVFMDNHTRAPKRVIVNSEAKVRVNETKSGDVNITITCKKAKVSIHKGSMVIN